MNPTTTLTALESAFAWVLGNTLAGGLLALVCWGIRACWGRRLSPAWLCLAGWLILARLLLPTTPMAPFAWNETLLTSARQDPPAPVEAAPMREAALAGAGQEPVAAKIVAVAPPSLIVLEPLAAEAGSGFRFTTATWLAALWLVGFSFLLSAVALRQWRFARKVRAASNVDSPWPGLVEDCAALVGLRRAPRLLAMDALASPMVCGLFRPKIAMPAKLLAELTEEEARHVLLHEMLHVAKRDILTNWLVFLARAAHWFNPLAQLALGRFASDRELLRDRQVIRLLGGGEAGFAYGHTLLKLAIAPSAPRLSPSQAPIFTSERDLKRRLIMIQEPIVRRPLWLGLTAATLAVAVAVLFTKAEGQEKQKAEAERARSDQAALSKLDDLLKEQRKKVDEARLTMLDVSERYRITDLRPKTAQPGDVLQDYELESKAATLKTQIDTLKVLSGEDLIKTAAMLDLKDPTLVGLYPDWKKLKLELTKLKDKGLGNKHPKVEAWEATVAKLEEMLMKAVTDRRAALEKEYKAASKALASAGDGLAERRKYEEYAEATKEHERQKNLLTNLEAQIAAKRVELAFREDPEKAKKRQEETRTSLEKAVAEQKAKVDEAHLRMLDVTEKFRIKSLQWDGNSDDAGVGNQSRVDRYRAEKEVRDLQTQLDVLQQATGEEKERIAAAIAGVSSGEKKSDAVRDELQAKITIARRKYEEAQRFEEHHVDSEAGERRKFAEFQEARDEWEFQRGVYSKLRQRLADHMIQEVAGGPDPSPQVATDSGSFNSLITTVESLRRQLGRSPEASVEDGEARHKAMELAAKHEDEITSLKESLVMAEAGLELGEEGRTNAEQREKVAALRRQLIRAEAEWRKAARAAGLSTPPEVSR